MLYDPELGERQDRLVEAAGTARALIVRNRTRVDEELLERLDALRVVGRLGVGLDNIDVEACARRGIPVRTAAGANADAVADYVVGAVLSLWRPALRDSDRVVRGTWPRSESIGTEAGGKTLGLLGLGLVSRAVARRAMALGMSVGAHDPYVAPGDRAWTGIANLDRDTVLASADALSIHLPLTEATARSIDAAAVGRMKPGALLINTARGGIVDEAAVLDALRTGSLGGAALDVFGDEPIDAAAGRRFEGVPNLILTPHIAGLTFESQERVGAMIAAAVTADLDMS